MKRRKRQTIGLAMMVKNEALVLERCLASVRPLIDHWTIVDTGSTDATRAVVEQSLHGIPGEFVERPWRDFARSRTESIDLARGRTDYCLILDADDVIERDPGPMPWLDVDCYELPVHHNDYVHYRPQLLRLDRPWRYVGPIHAYLSCDAPFTRAPFSFLRYRVIGGGARAKDPRKYQKDVEQLTALVGVEPWNARYRFYLAQSHRDAGNLEDAIRVYRERAAMGGWDEEVFYSLYEVGCLLRAAKHSLGEVTNALLVAHAARPSRAEPLFRLARVYREEGEFALAHTYAERACLVPMPDDTLLVDRAIYDWKALDELSLAAYHTGRYVQAEACIVELLTHAPLPDGQRPRVEANKRCVDAALAVLAAHTRRVAAA